MVSSATRVLLTTIKFVYKSEVFDLLLVVGAITSLYIIMGSLY